MIAPDGTLVEQVPTGDRVTTNIAFGGPELKTGLHHAVRQGRTDRDGLGAARLAAEFLEQVMMAPSIASLRGAKREAIHESRANRNLWIASLRYATTVRSAMTKVILECPGLNRLPFAVRMRGSSRCRRNIARG